jgi:hypothetical protein
MEHSCRRLSFVLLLATLASGRAAGQTQRPFRVDDLFEMEDVGWYCGGPYAFSADESKLAFTRVRRSLPIEPAAPLRPRPDSPE